MLSATSTTRDQLTRCLDLIYRGQIRPVIEAAIPLKRGARAQHMIEAGECIGRVILHPTSA